MMKMSFFGGMIMLHFLLFVITFLIVFLVFKVVLEDGLKRDIKNVKEVETAKKLFNLDEEKIDKKELLTGVAIINAFIVATTFIVVDIIGLDKIYWFIAALAVILVLIVVCYFIYGKILYWKWGKDKDDKKL